MSEIVHQKINIMSEYIILSRKHKEARVLSSWHSKVTWIVFNQTDYESSYLHFFFPPLKTNVGTYSLGEAILLPENVLKDSSVENGKSSKRCKLVSTNLIWDSMRTDSGTEEDNIYHVLLTWVQIWQWDSTCAKVVSLNSKAQVVDYSQWIYVSKVCFSVVYTLVPFCHRKRY